MSIREVFLSINKHRKYLWAFPLISGAVIALFSPVDVLRFAPAKWIVETMAIIVPMINNIKANYDLTEVAQLYFAVMWLTTPIIYYSVEVGSKEELLIKLKANKSLFWLICMFSIFVWLFGGYYFFYVGPSPFGTSGHDFFILHTRLGMATYGSVILMGFVILPKLLIQVVSCFSHIYLQRSKK